MNYTARLSYTRQSARKVRKVADVVRGMPVMAARAQLSFMPQKAGATLLKLLNSAIANAVNNFDATAENLYIKTLLVNVGPTLKRYRPRSQGRAFGILKRSSSIDIVLADRTPGKKGGKKKKVQEVASMNLADFAKQERENKAKEAEEAKTNKPDMKKVAAAKSVATPKSAATSTKNTLFRRKGDA